LARTGSSSAVLDPNTEANAVLLSSPRDAGWEGKVLASEKKAHELMEKIRAGLAPHLAQAMVSELVQRLLADRAALLEAQNLATAELREIEERFAQVQNDLAERLASYQARNSHLEKQLAARSAENTELLKTHIDELQKKSG